MAENIHSIGAVTPEVDAEAVAYLRELADRFERGEVRNLVVVFNDNKDNVYERFGHFKDRWTILGALEYAKSTIHQAD